MESLLFYKQILKLNFIEIKHGLKGRSHSSICGKYTKILIKFQEDPDDKHNFQLLKNTTFP